MVAGQSVTKPLMAVDLDGTYIRCNSLRVYLRCGILHSIKRLRFCSAIKASALMSLRAARLISHKTMKWGCIEAVGCDSVLLEKVGTLLRQNINHEVEQLIEDYRNRGYEILLATAAPDFYIPEIWSGDFVATVIADGPAKECRGAEKLQRVLDYAERNRLTLKTVVTDHSDDMPLICHNITGTNFIVSPNGLKLIAPLAQNSNNFF